MLHSEKNPLPHKVILVHKGALGDFLQVWPALCSLTRYWGQEKAFLWAGREQYSLWTSPLGIHACPGRLRREIDSLYSVRSRPAGLQDCLVIWFGLKKYPLKEHFPWVWFLPGLDPGVLRPPREVYANHLAGFGVPFHDGWLSTWRDTIARQETEHKEGMQVLIFPGAGDLKRCWPLDRFQALGEWLTAKGWRVRFVYGPAEMERGFPVKKFESICPHDFSELQALLARASLVVGNDSGPMHLAAYLGVPVVALFGPAAPEQWGPYQGKTLKQPLACAPCTETGVINCTRPECIQDLTLERVQDALKQYPPAA